MAGVSDAAHRCARRFAIAALLIAGATTSSGCANYWKARAHDFGDCFRLGAGFGLGLYAEAEATSLVQPAVGFADVNLKPRYSLDWDPRPSPPGELRTAAFPTLLVAWPFHGWNEVEEGYGDTHPYLRAFFAPWALVGSHHVRKESIGLLGLGGPLGNPRFAEERALEARDRERVSTDGVAEGSSDLDLKKGETPEPRGSGASRHGWVAASGTVLFVHVDAGVNLVEWGDLLVGFFGWDPLTDDSKR